MDLKAYLQIENLEHYLTDNNIIIPRVRGIDLCSESIPYTDEQIKAILHDIEIDCCESLCESYPYWDANASCFKISNRTMCLQKFYVSTEGDTSFIRWDRIHGWKRKVLKTYIHNQKMAFLKYVAKYNSYCGKENVLRVHSRMGGDNWTWKNDDWTRQKTEIINAPWFIERVNEWCDTTYCDFYVRINEER